MNQPATEIQVAISSALLSSPFSFRLLSLDQVNFSEGAHNRSSVTLEFQKLALRFLAISFRGVIPEFARL